MARKRPEPREPETQEVPPVEDWRVVFSEPGAPTPKAPWRIEAIESSGRIFVKAVQDLVGEHRAQEMADSSPAATLALQPPAVLAPSARGSRARRTALLTTIALAGIAVAAGLGYVAGSRGNAPPKPALRSAVTGPNLAPKRASVPGEKVPSAAPLLARAPEEAAREAGRSETAPPAGSTQAAAPPAGSTQAAASPDPPRTNVEATSAAATLGHHARSSRKRSARSRRAAEKKAERKADEEVDQNAEAAQLPGALEALRRARPAPRAAAKEPATRAAAKKPAPRATSVGEKLRLLQQAAADPRAASTAPHKATLPERLSPEALRRHARQLQLRARACLRRFGIAFQLLHVRVVIQGATGQVRSARVLGSHHGTPAGRCIERAATHMRFGRFTRPRQTVTVPVAFR